MMNQLAERMWVAALSMSPGHLVDKSLDWLEELRVAMSMIAPPSTEARWLADPDEQRAASFEEALCAWMGRC